MENVTPNAKIRKIIPRPEFDPEAYARIWSGPQLTDEQIQYQKTLPVWLVESLNRYYGFVSMPPTI